MKPNQTIFDIKNSLMKHKKDILVVAFIFLLSLLFLKDTLGSGRIMNNVHHLHEQTFFSFNHKAALEQGTLPFWTPYWYGGQPFFGDSQVFFMNLTFIFIFLFRNIFLAINLSHLLYFFISGASMYFAAKNFVGARASAFISALVYMFNGLIYGFVAGGNPSILEPYSLMPLIFLFVSKAKKSRNPVNYSIIAGIFLAFQIFSGGALLVVYSLLLIGCYIAFDMISSKFVSSLIKSAIVLVVMFAVFFGLSAVKLLPNYDFIKNTNRAEGVSYQEYIGDDHFVFKDFLKIIVTSQPSQSIKVHLGFTAFILVLLSAAFFRKKIVLALIGTSIFIFLLASGNFIAKFFYEHVPTFAQTRHIGRVVFVFVFAASVLAGFGYNSISSTLDRIKTTNKTKAVFFVVIAALIFSELVLAKGFPKGFNMQEQLEENELAKYLGEIQLKEGKFRITTFDIDDVISFYGSSYYAQYGLETISGGGGLWINDYVNYLGVAKRYDNSKLLGILNLRYATSTKEAVAPGFSLVKKFSECKPCKKHDAVNWIDGPYLYENENYLPRYYFVNNSVLIIGDKNQAQDLAYFILLNKNFNPKSAVVVQGNYNRVNDYSLDFLRKFNAVILASKKPIDNVAVELLGKYKNSGGKIFPDVLDNKQSIDTSEIEALLASLKGGSIEVDSKSVSSNEVILFPKNIGFLVLSEKFSLFDEWSAKKDGNQMPILRADNVISAVYVDSPGAITFKFVPKSFSKGLMITLLTLIALSAYWLYVLYLRFKQQWQK